MITIFASPKPFIGHIGVIQRNAIRSWRQLGDDVQIILFGNEEGITETAREVGADHHPEVAKNSFDTPLLSDMLKQAETSARHQVMCFINSDIMLTSGFIDAIREVQRQCQKYLMIGQCWNMDVTTPLEFKEGWESELQSAVKKKGTRRDAYSIDYFIFPKNLYGQIPDFAIGRGWFDHWLVWKPIDLGAFVINSTASIDAVHQNHDYGHVKGGVVYAHRGEEAQINFSLAGGPKHMRCIYNTTHRLVRGKLRRDLIGSYFPKSTRSIIDTYQKKAVDVLSPIIITFKKRRKV